MFLLKKRINPKIERIKRMKHEPKKERTTEYMKYRKKKKNKTKTKTKVGNEIYYK